MLESAMSDDERRGLGDSSWEELSAMVDGEADAAQQARCLVLWQSEDECRARWNEYQLIGDVMRSDELVDSADAEAAFLHRLRGRLAREPVAFQPVVSAPVHRPAMGSKWLGPMAIAAGVGAVALTLTLLGPSKSGSVGETTLAGAARPGPATLQSAVSVEPQLRVVSGQLIRDARLDRYLAAHRQGANGAALQMPGSVVRSVDTIVLEGK